MLEPLTCIFQKPYNDKTLRIFICGDFVFFKLVDATDCIIADDFEEIQTAMPLTDDHISAIAATLTRKAQAEAARIAKLKPKGRPVGWKPKAKAKDTQAAPKAHRGKARGSK